MLANLTIEGTSFEVGVALGRFGARAVHDHLKHTAAWNTAMKWRKDPRADAMSALVQHRHPQYWQELVGLASGLDMPLEDVFLWNCRGDLWAMAPDGCTTVQLPGALPVFAHNEDGDPGFAGRCAIAEIAVNDGGRFASFVYPGSLPGHTFAANATGMAMTVNNLRTLHVEPGLPRMIVARAILDLPSVAAAIEYLRTAPRAGGFHLTLAQAGQVQLTSVEFNSSMCSVRVIDEAALHSNHMIHPAMANHPQIVTGSSGYRQIRGDLMLADLRRANVDIDPLTILFDQGNERFPIYRDAPDDSDVENTMATARFEVLANRVEWTVFAGRSREPLYRMRNGSRI
jgi:predicted choloylglycine hydrolase